jgi:uncharacterized repeat protein (TIGR03809 family)
MTDTIDNLRDYQVVRWRQLAEKRLDHITDLFVSGRWARYFGEADFLEIIRQSKAAVEAWRRLETAELPGSLLTLPTLLADHETANEPPAADHMEAELAAVNIAMAQEDESDTSIAPPAQPLKSTPVEPKAVAAASLLPSPFEDAYAAAILQRLRQAI